MPVTAIAFTLPQENYQHRCAVNSHLVVASIRELDDHLRIMLKHGHIANLSSSDLAKSIRATIAENLALVDA